MQAPNERVEASAFAKAVPAIAILLALLAISSSLARSAAIGRLSIPPAFDDVSYILDGLNLYDIFLEKGLLGEISPIMHQHAPLQSLLAMLGDLLFGLHRWSPYLANGFLVIGFALVLLALTRSLHPISRLAILAYIISLPLTGNLIAEFRPDFSWGLLCGLAIYLLLDPGFLSTNRLQACTAALCVALALLAKPSASPATAAVLGLATLLGIWLQGKLVSRLAYLSLFLATAGLLTGPFFIINARALYDYIHTALVDQQDIYALKAPFWSQATFYITGFVNETTLGSAFWVGIALFVWNCGFLFVRAVRAELARYVSFGLVVFIAYLIPTAEPVKSPFLGSIFYGAFLFLTVRGLILAFRISDNVGPRTRFGRLINAPQILLMFLGLITFHGWDLLSASLNEQWNAKEWTMAYDYLTAAIEKAVVAANVSRRAVVLVTGAYPINDKNITILGREHGIKMEGDPGYYVRTLSEMKEKAKRADFVLISEKFMGRYPGTDLNPALLSWLNGSNGFSLLSDYSYGDGLHAYLFGKATFSVTGVRGDWIDSSGITLHVYAKVLQRLPFLVLQGHANYEWLGGVPKPHATLIRSDGSILELPCWLISKAPGYQLVIDSRQVKDRSNREYSIHVTFDRYFVPKMIGINDDTRKLVIGAPSSTALLGHPPTN